MSTVTPERLPDRLVAALPSSAQFFSAELGRLLRYHPGSGDPAERPPGNALAQQL
jgi:hypothetical protein